MLDYCEGVFTGLSKKKKQIKQNINQHQDTGKSLHWLTVCKRIDFKILLLVYKALNDLNTLQCEASRPLRSSGTGLFSVPRVRTKKGEAAFSIYAPRLWNKQPAHLRFMQKLSAHLNQDRKHECFLQLSCKFRSLFQSCLICLFNCF